MTFILILEGSLGQCVPLALTASLELEAAVGLMLPELNAKIAGLLQLQASLTLTPPTTRETPSQNRQPNRPLSVWPVYFFS